MHKSQIASCPDCGGRIPFKQFVQLNNFSATNCSSCNTRIEISNRTTNAVMAGISGFMSAVAIVFCAYFGEQEYQSLFGGIFFGLCLATLFIVGLCSYAYRHSRLNRICNR